MPKALLLAGIEKEVEKVKKSEQEWRKLLTPEQFQVTRKKGTERAFTGKYAANQADGISTASAAARRFLIASPSLNPAQAGPVSISQSPKRTCRTFRTPSMAWFARKRFVSFAKLIWDMYSMAVPGRRDCDIA